MRFVETAIPGVAIIEPEPFVDDRGSFVRFFDNEEFRSRGLVTRFDQDSLSHNERAGTIRGLHYQAVPFGETKVVVCVAGSAFDVIVDLRPGPTLGMHVEIELHARTFRGVYIPAGCAHGFQALQNDTTLLYCMSGRYRPDAARGIRWDDPQLGIAWPLPVTSLSHRDATLPLFSQRDDVGFEPLVFQ